MRKAEEYATECHNSDKFDFAKHSEIIKRVIIEVIDEVVKRCVNINTFHCLNNESRLANIDILQIADQLKKELE